MIVPEQPALDRAAEPWTGTFSGLGTVTIAADGTVDVTVEAADDEDPTSKEQALRWGWGEGLSFVRRGYLIASGAAACPLEDSGVCLLLPGDPHDVAIVLAALADRGWSVLGDRFTPVRWEGSTLVAHPRQAPLIMARRRLDKLGLTGTPVRTDSDARAVDLPRTTEPRVVGGVAAVSMRRPHEEAVTVLAGQQRFEAAAQLMMGGVMQADPADDDVGDTTARATALLAEHLRLATLPACRLRLDQATLDDDLAALLRWWADVAPDWPPA